MGFVATAAREFSVLDETRTDTSSGREYTTFGYVPRNIRHPRMDYENYKFTNYQMSHRRFHYAPFSVRNVGIVQQQTNGEQNRKIKRGTSIEK